MGASTIIEAKRAAKEAGSAGDQRRNTGDGKAKEKNKEEGEAKNGR